MLIYVQNCFSKPTVGECLVATTKYCSCKPVQTIFWCSLVNVQQCIALTDKMLLASLCRTGFICGRLSIMLYSLAVHFCVSCTTARTLPPERSVKNVHRREIHYVEKLLESGWLANLPFRWLVFLPHSQVDRRHYWPWWWWWWFAVYHRSDTSPVCFTRAVGQRDLKYSKSCPLHGISPLLHLISMVTARWEGVRAADKSTTMQWVGVSGRKGEEGNNTQKKTRPLGPARGTCCAQAFVLCEEFAVGWAGKAKAIIIDYALWLAVRFD